MSLIDAIKTIEDLVIVSREYSHFEILFVNDKPAYHRIIKKLQRKGLNGEVERHIDRPVGKNATGTNFFISFPGRTNLLSVLEEESSYYVIYAKKDKRGSKYAQIFENTLGERAFNE